MVQIRSEYNINTFCIFQKFSLKKVFVLSYICGLLLLGIGIGFSFAKISNYKVYLFLGIALPLFMYIYYRMIVSLAVNKNVYLQNKTIQIFTFDDQEIKLEQISPNKVFKEKYFYDEIIKIVKYKRYYFLYVNQSQAFIIKNEDYVVGTEEELDEMFKKIKGKNFIVKRSSKKRLQSGS